MQVLMSMQLPREITYALLTDRPPNLETPLKYFLLDYTPNNVFFVRWHLSNLPPEINPDTFRLRVDGHVSNPLELSLNDLKTKFPAVTITALAQCAGNSKVSTIHMFRVDNGKTDNKCEMERCAARWYPENGWSQKELSMFPSMVWMKLLCLLHRIL